MTLTAQQRFNVTENAPRFHIVGTGGIAVVLIEVMFDMGFRLGKVYDDDSSVEAFQGIEVRATEQLYADADATKKSEQPLFVCIGDNAVRKKIATAIDAPMMVARHRSAEISPTASVAGGTMVFHGSYIQAGATLGHHVIVNTAASVDHDCRIADFVHIAPQVGLSGGVEIGEGSEIGVGACVLPNIHIGKWTKVGAGATVIKDLPDFAVAVGTPAKVIRLNGEPV